MISIKLEAPKALRLTMSLAARSGLPLIMLGLVATTPLWGGYVTLAVAVLFWRVAGVWL